MVATKDSSAPRVTIMGATGNQGGSVLEHLVKSDKPYRIRAITRDAKKPAAQKLRDVGAETVEGDLADRASLEKAIEGSDIIFVVTNFWARMDFEADVNDGKMVIDIAEAAKVKLIVWSGLESVRDVSQGKITDVLHFDGKAIVTQYAKDKKLPLANVQPGCYMSNFLTNWAPRKQGDGTYAMFQPCSPDTVFSLLNCDRDYGAYVRLAIENPKFGAGSEVLACADELSVAEMANQLSEITGKTIKFVQIPDEAFLKAVPGPAGPDLLGMLKWFQDFGYFGGKDTGPSNRDLQVKVQSWRDFAKEQDWAKIMG